MTKHEMRDFAQSQVEWYTKQIEWDRNQIKRINERLAKTRKDDKAMAEWALAKYPDDQYVQTVYSKGYKGEETKKLERERSKYYRQIKKYQAYVEQYKQEVNKYTEAQQEAQEATNTNETKEEENTMKNTNTKEYKFEIREIDAWNYGEDEGWIWNTSYLMGEMQTKAKDEKRAFVQWLRKHGGIIFKKNRTLIEYDGDVYTIIDRKTKEPLFAAIPMYA